MLNFGMAAGMATLVCSNALAVWGVKYEVNSGWTNPTTIDVSGGAKTVDFRISVYHDGVTQVLSASGLKTALACLRLCNSQKITDFGSAGSGDELLAYQCIVSSVNNKALEHSQVGANMILGTPNSVLSFASDTNHAPSKPILQKLETRYYAGQIRIGTGAGTARTVSITANSFGYPNAGTSAGGQYGASFYVSPTVADSGIVLAPAVVVPAIITVEIPCPADLDGDRVVGDADFSIFAAAADIYTCSDTSMPAGCPADLNGDGFVDESDFTIFALAYDEVLCP
ncbi:MAG: hypothetical protein KF691_10335 [Phycisphaeraceae bacterium]|nr:hypothetical protein [Phycisphaeraceae bacterium]